MLRHIRNQEIYWFCPFCHQEMPNLMSLLHKRECLINTVSSQKKMVVGFISQHA